MKKILKNSIMPVAIAGLSLVVGASVECPPYDPENPDTWDKIYVPDPDDCSAFYECYLGAGFRAECPNGLLFCSELKVCTWADEFGYTCSCGDDFGNGSGAGGSEARYAKTFLDCSVEASVDGNGYIHLFGRRINVGTGHVGGIYRKTYYGVSIDCPAGKTHYDCDVYTCAQFWAQCQ
jgi:hypothetical protein